MCVCKGGGVSSQHDLLSMEKTAISQKQEIQVGRLPHGLRNILPCRSASFLIFKGGLRRRVSPDTPASFSED